MEIYGGDGVVEATVNVSRCLAEEMSRDAYINKYYNDSQISRQVRPGFFLGGQVPTSKTEKFV